MGFISGTAHVAETAILKGDVRLSPDAWVCDLARVADSSLGSRSVVGGCAVVENPHLAEGARVLGRSVGSLTSRIGKLRKKGLIP